MTKSNWLRWEGARPVASKYFNFWPDGEDLIWAKHCWSALDKSGLNIYQNDEEEIDCRKNVGILALVYNEACCRYGEVNSCSYLDDEQQTEILKDIMGIQDDRLHLIVRSSLLVNFGL